jgi:hypothetical protein
MVAIRVRLHLPESSDAPARRLLDGESKSTFGSQFTIAYGDLPGALSIPFEKAKARVRHPEPCQLDWQNGCGLASLVGSAHDAEAAQGSQPA